MFLTFKRTFQQLTIGQSIFGYTLLGLLLAWHLIYIEHGWVNDDFVLYQEVARLFAAGEFKAGFKLYNWPFYSGLISLVHKLFGTSLLLSAQLITSLLFGITTYSYLTLISLAGGNRLTLFSGAMILFSSHYIAGDVVAMLLRDPGFWAFFLSSLVFFIKFCQQASFKNAVLWQICALLAMLFRVEGITFLLFLPLIILTSDFSRALHTCTLHQRMMALLKAYGLNVLLILLVITLFAFSPSLSIKDLGRLQEIAALFDNKIGYILSTFASRSDLLAEGVLNGHFDDYAVQGLVFALAGIAALKIISALGWFNLGLTTYFFVGKSPSLNLHVKRILIYAAILALINIVLILLSVMLIATRYVIPLVLIMFIFSAFSLGNLLDSLTNIQWRHKRYLDILHTLKLKHWLTILILLGMLISFISITLPKKQGNNFEQDAVAYLIAKKIPNEAVFFVSPRARFYAGANYAGRGYEYWEFTQEAVLNQSIYQYEYLLINIYIDDTYVKRKAFLDANLKDYVLEKEFYGFKNKKKVMFYHKKH